MKFRGIWQDVGVRGNCIYLVLIHGEFGSIIRGTAVILLEDEIWDDEWKKRKREGD